MICPEKVQELCLFGMMCPREAIVDDDSECAPYIRRMLAKLEGVEPAQVDPVEDAELEQEREAIREECALKPCPFCGGEAATDVLPSGLWIAGCTKDRKCMGHIMHLTMVFKTAADAVEAWNRRDSKCR